MHAHPLDLRVADRGDADPRREPLEPEPRGVDLLEVLARQPADERAARLADLDEPLALERREADADRRLRDAEPLGEVPLHERRPGRQLPADDQVAERSGDPLLDRLAADRLDLVERLRARPRLDELRFHFRPLPLYARPAAI